MFKCTNCNEIFKIKPDYCDCGNDTFEELEEKVEAKVEENIEKKENIERHVEKKLYEYSPFSKFKAGLDPISVTVFLICIILSILSLIFIGNDNSKNKEENKLKNEQVKAEKTKTEKVPSIESLWNDELPKNVKVVAKKVETIKPKEEPTSKVTNNKSIEQNKTKKKEAAPVKTTSQASVTNKVSNEVKKSTPTQEDKQALVNYKISLRNKIASNIDFISIIGDGECVVSFNINSKGELINRKFLKQSENDMLNDGVYNAMMTVPTYKTPPKLYKGEVLKLSVKFLGGNFEVDLN